MIFETALFLFSFITFLEFAFNLAVLVYSAYFFIVFCKADLELNRKSYNIEERKQIQSNLSYFKNYFIILTLTLLVRQITLLLNDFLSFYIPENKDNLIFRLNVLYSICFYLSEVIVLEVLSNSLKWSLKTSKRYRSNKA